MKKLYYPTHTRMGVWLIGVLLGYVLYSFKQRTIIISPFIQFIGWVSSLLTIFAVIFGQYNLVQLGGNDHLLSSVIYNSCDRIAWGLSLGWIIFVCAKGYGGAVNWFLSLSFWIPLSRLSYSICVTHFIVIMMRAGERRTNSFFNELNAVRNFWVILDFQSAWHCYVV